MTLTQSDINNIEAAKTKRESRLARNRRYFARQRCSSIIRTESHILFGKDQSAALEKYDELAHLLEIATEVPLASIVFVSRLEQQMRATGRML